MSGNWRQIWSVWGCCHYRGRASQCRGELWWMQWPCMISRMMVSICWDELSELWFYISPCIRVRGTCKSRIARGSVKPRTLRLMAENACYWLVFETPHPFFLLICLYDIRPMSQALMVKAIVSTLSHHVNLLDIWKINNSSKLRFESLVWIRNDTVMQGKLGLAPHVTATQIKDPRILRLL